MYKIYADDTLIYDSTVEDYKIDKGSISLETNKSGSFTFSIYPDHFYYDHFVKLKTVITVYKSGRIVFRGRILNDVSDYKNNKVITCEGELGFLQDSIIRPFEFKGNPADLFLNLIESHNAQVDEFKKFKIGEVTVEDPNGYIARSNSGYESALSNLTSRLIEDSLGGYIVITHGDDGTDKIPTINYLSDFTHTSTQKIEFGSNLKNYTKTVKADSIATAIIPLGATVDDGDSETEDPKLTIKSVNNGKDYVFDSSAVAMYGWIFKVVEWNDVTTPSALKAKAEAYLMESINQNITIELNAIDLHLLDKSIESFKLGDYIRVTSEPHNFDATLLCNKQTLDLLKPENDSITLGYTYSSFTEMANRINGVSNSVKYNREEVYKTINSHDVAVQRLTSLMSQSFGVFKTEEISDNGSYIYYMHDKQTLKDSSTIWKMTADGFAVSTDGGNTWTSGLDSSGNAVLNVLSTIGVKAEWIDADNLNAISSVIGGWSIDDKAIYKDVTDPNDAKVVYRVYFQPPLLTNVEKTWILSCQKSTNGGKTFTGTFVLYSDGSAKFGNTTISGTGDITSSKCYIKTDGSAKIGDNVIINADGSAKIGSLEIQKDGSLTIGDTHISDNGLIRLENGNRSFLVDNIGIRILEDGLPLGYLMVEDDEIKCKVDSVECESVKCKTYNDYEGYTGMVTIGDANLTVYNGIITNVS